jgi:hypothetical protein
MSCIAARPWHEGERPQTLCVQGHRTRVYRMGQLRTDRMLAALVSRLTGIYQQDSSSKQPRSCGTSTPGLTPALPYQRLGVDDGHFQRVSEQREDRSEVAVRRLSLRTLFTGCDGKRPKAGTRTTCCYAKCAVPRLAQPNSLHSSRTPLPYRWMRSSR